MPRIHQDMTALPALPHGRVVAIGNFDGVHPGHMALINRAGDIAAAQKLTAAVLTFEPHPREFFAPEGEPFRLTLLPIKAHLNAAAGVRDNFAQSFDAGLAG